MGKYFGTDGFRGEAGITLTADHAYKVGRFLGWYYNALRERNGNSESARIVIGKDTRRSMSACLSSDNRLLPSLFSYVFYPCFPPRSVSILTALLLYCSSSLDVQ